MGPTLAAGLCAAQPASIGVVVSNASIGSTGYPQRQKGTAPYINVLAGVAAKARISRLTGSEYEERFLVLIEGEQENGVSKSTYMGYKTTERANFDADFKTITRQSWDLVSVMDQLPYRSSDVPLAQVQLALDDPMHFINWGPGYHLPVAPNDTIHNATLAREIAGYEASRAINLWLAGIMPEPFRITSVQVTGGVNGVANFGGYFNGAVTIDTSVVTDPGNYGLNFIDAGNGNSVSIVPGSVAMISNTQVGFTLSATPTATNRRLGTARIPFNVPNIGPVNGARACFFDSAGDTCVIGGATYTLRRPASHWETPITFI